MDLETFIGSQSQLFQWPVASTLWEELKFLEPVVTLGNICYYPEMLGVGKMLILPVIPISHLETQQTNKQTNTHLMWTINVIFQFYVKCAYYNF